ncbi:MAG: hypothetical protein ABR511_00345 [Acidimicrobiales bacterium]
MDVVDVVDAAAGTVCSVRTVDLQDLAIRTTPGYDGVTGLGVPEGVAFLRRIQPTPRRPRCP